MTRFEPTAASVDPDRVLLDDDARAALVRAATALRSVAVRADRRYLAIGPELSGTSQAWEVAPGPGGEFWPIRQVDGEGADARRYAWFEAMVDDRGGLSDQPMAVEDLVDDEFQRTITRDGFEALWATATRAGER
ncbi:hypothetical protein [Cellulomonas taurus]|jgi:hypothetical protein|uniref:hypothetical protein n=1 Tax=Cellulomonas taurus TaxID=2729175 RepID=UPI00145D54BE|nr:hypothetical protein [Cellulomonas taurus]